MTFDLIFPAMLVFLLMMVGVVLTVIEFNKLEREESEREKRSEAGRPKNNEMS